MAEITSVITLLFLVFLFPLGVQLWKLTLCRPPSSPMSSNVYLLLLWTVCLSVCIAQNGTAGDDRFKAVEMGSDGSSVLAGHINETDSAVTVHWLAVKLDAGGNIVWTWQDDTAGDEDDLLYAAAMGEDESVVLAGAAAGNFQVIKLDADGSLVWRYQNGTPGNDTARGIATGDDGSVVAVGTTLGDWNITNERENDMAAFKLHADGSLIWKWQEGACNEWAKDVSMADDGSVVLVGFSNGYFDVADATVSDSSNCATPYDFVAVKLDSEGAEVWRWEDGAKDGDNFLNSVSMTEDGSYILAGRTEGNWNVEPNGESDFAAVKLDPDGNEVWRWQDGTSEDDSITDTAVRDDGTIILGGYTAGNWTGSNAGGNDFAVVALDADGKEIWRWQNGSALADLSGDDSINGISVSADGRIIMAGKTSGSYAATNFGGGDLVAVMLDTGESATPAPTTAPSSAPVPSSTPGPTTARPPTAAPASPPAPTPTPSSPATPATTPAPTPTSSPPATPATTPAPTPTSSSPATSATTLAPTPGPSPAATQAASSVTPITVWVASAVGGVVVIVLGLYQLKRHIAKKKRTAQQAHPPVIADGGGDGPPALPPNPSPSSPPRPHTVSAAADDVEGGRKCVILPFPAPFVRVVQPRAGATTHAGNGGGGGGGGGGGVSLAKGDAEPTTHAGKYDGGGIAVEGDAEPTTHDDDGGGREIRLAEGDFGDGSAEQMLTITPSTINISTGEGDQLAPAYGGSSVVGAALVTDEPKPALDEIGASLPSHGRGLTGGLGLGEVVGDAARELARNCPIPGVVEVATAVSILVDLVTDYRGTKNGTEASLRRCRSTIIMLQRAAKVLGKGGETIGTAERVMIEDVHDAIFDLVELIKTYQSKNKLSQVLISTLFRRRQDEMGEAVERAILNLQWGLHVQVGSDVSAVKDGMDLYKGSMEEAQSKALAEAREARRQRKLDQIEIPEANLTITDELLGTGGFGEVYLADYNGRNAAAKVMHASNNLGGHDDNDVQDESTRGQVERRRVKGQRKAFLLELDAMIRLRSPYTVNVYGAVTVMQDRLVLVMELLSGGDLGTFLRNCEHPLPEQQSRQIIGDICAGMTFLHSKETVHGDLKSANALLDGAGRVKIGDFGTAKWTQQAMSTGLVTFTTKCRETTQMSLAWSAPEVLHAAGSTYASDVYSFGIVVWEVLSREIPWATVTHPRDIYIRVVLNDLRPVIPDDAPTEIADVARACWVGEPRDRPTFMAIMEDMKSNHCNE